MTLAEICLASPPRPHPWLHERSAPFTKHTPLFLIYGSCLSPCFKKRSFARFCLRSVFRTRNWHSGSDLSRLPHGTHIFSADVRILTRSVAFRTHGVFFRPRLRVGLNHPTAQERIFETTWEQTPADGSNVDDDQSALVAFATTLAQGCIIDRAFQSRIQFFCCVDVHSFILHFVYCLVLVASWPAISFEVTPLAAHAALFVMFVELCLFAFAFALSSSHFFPQVFVCWSFCYGQFSTFLWCRLCCALSWVIESFCVVWRKPFGVWVLGCEELRRRACWKGPHWRQMKVKRSLIRCTKDPPIARRLRDRQTHAIAAFEAMAGLSGGTYPVGSGLSNCASLLLLLPCLCRLVQCGRPPSGLALSCHVNPTLVRV